MRFTRNKYGVAPADERRLNGRTYASKAEMQYAQQLYMLREACVIIDFIEQPRLWLGVPENVYIPDFLVIPCEGTPWYCDVKGKETTQFKKVKKLWASYGRLDLHIVMKSGQGFKTTEVIKGGAAHG